jgi:hypothetical protein
MGEFWCGLLGNFRDGYRGFLRTFWRWFWLLVAIGTNRPGNPMPQLCFIRHQIPTPAHP